MTHSHRLCKTNAFVSSIRHRMKRFQQLSIGINQSWIITEFVHHENTYRYCRCLGNRLNFTKSWQTRSTNANKMLPKYLVDQTNDIVLLQIWCSVHGLSYWIDKKKIEKNLVILMSWFTQFESKSIGNLNFTSNYYCWYSFMRILFKFKV